MSYALRSERAVEERAGELCELSDFAHGERNERWAGNISRLLQEQTLYPHPAPQPRAQQSNPLLGIKPMVQDPGAQIIVERSVEQ